MGNTVAMGEGTVPLEDLRRLSSQHPYQCDRVSSAVLTTTIVAEPNTELRFNTTGGDDLELPVDTGAGQRAVVCSVIITGCSVHGLREDQSIRIALDGDTPSRIKGLVLAQSHQKPATAPKPLAISPDLDGVPEGMAARPEAERQTSELARLIKLKLGCLPPIMTDTRVFGGTNDFSIRTCLLQRPGVLDPNLCYLLGVQDSLQPPAGAENFCCWTLFNSPLPRLVIDKHLLPDEQISVGIMRFGEEKTPTDFPVRILRSTTEHLCSALNTHVFKPLIFYKPDGLRIIVAWPDGITSEQRPVAVIRVEVRYILISVKEQPGSTEEEDLGYGNL